MVQGKPVEELREGISAVDNNARDIKRILERMQNERGAQSVSGIHFDTGSAGVWIAVTCCAIMLVALAIIVPVAVGAYLDQREEIRRLEDSDNAIRAYITTGILKPKPESN